MLTPLSVLAIVLSLAVAASDLYARRVPNAWLLAALGLGAAIALANGGWSSPPWQPLLGLLAGLAALLPFHVFGWMGAGDVKFFAVLGFLLGAPALLPVWVIGSLLGGAHALAALAADRWCALALPGSQQLQAWRAPAANASPAALRRARPGLPYAAYLAVGAVTTALMPGLAHWWTA